VVAGRTAVRGGGGAEVLCRYHAHGEQRITRSPEAVLAARRLLVSRHADELPAVVRAHHRARLALDDPRAGVLTRLRVLASTPPRVLWQLAAGSLSGAAGGGATIPQPVRCGCTAAVHR